MEITKRVSFAAAHRLKDHQGRCAFLHGHNYNVDITIESSTPNELGMVVDFTDVKNTIGKWIDDNWDHAFIYNDQDPVAQDVVAALKKHYVSTRTFAMTGNPTAENMANYLTHYVVPFLKLSLRCVTFRVWETPTSSASGTWMSEGDGDND